MADKQGIEIDYCPTCRGIWLDRGELEKIIERSNQPYPPSRGNYTSESDRYSGYNNDHHDKHSDEHGSQGYDQYGRKKKKGLLGDLFDF
jgi:hypothetical protein